MAGFMDGFMQGYEFTERQFDRYRQRERQDQLDRERQEDRTFNKDMASKQLGLRQRQVESSEKSAEVNRQLGGLQMKQINQKMEHTKEDRERGDKKRELEASIYRVQSAVQDLKQGKQTSLDEKTLDTLRPYLDKGRFQEMNELSSRLQNLNSFQDINQPDVLEAINKNTTYAEQIKRRIGKDLIGEEGTIEDVVISKIVPGSKEGTVGFQLDVLAKKKDGTRFQTQVSATKNGEVLELPIETVMNDIKGRTLLPVAMREMMAEYIEVGGQLPQSQGQKWHLKDGWFFDEKSGRREFVGIDGKGGQSSSRGGTDKLSGKAEELAYLLSKGLPLDEAINKVYTERGPHFHDVVLKRLKSIGQENELMPSDQKLSQDEMLGMAIKQAEQIMADREPQESTESDGGLTVPQTQRLEQRKPTLKHLKLLRANPKLLPKFIEAFGLSQVPKDIPIGQYAPQTYSGLPTNF
ncbi:hypothetical protein [Pleionea sp. CnH1-48]|uniref:hypothetical protein n=1 Tax=Pleionea sp. CnH1-48 TaxID=2954494 RepID=UPI0020980702|nr:hypothetical protein [Pleionea sp. CnH1-48]MCO7225936.1 hypothetical protein [Pleionea sp. CnH1-48]